MMTKQTENDLQREVFNEYLLLQGMSEKTRGTILRTVGYYTAWVEAENMEVESTSYNDIVAYVNHCKNKGNKPRTLQVAVNCIKHYYHFLQSRGLVNDNPCLGIAIKGVKRKVLYETYSEQELESIYQTFSAAGPGSGLGSALTHVRNKIILGLIVFQGLRSEELARLRVEDIWMREGKVYVAGGRRTNERELTLHAHQLYDLMDYIHQTRKQILALTGNNSEALFLSLGGSDRFSNIMTMVLGQIRTQQTKTRGMQVSRVKEIKQLRASVIAGWLKVHNIRKVQHMAGHRYVSSTEGYQTHNMDNLKEDISRYHPDL